VPAKGCGGQTDEEKEAALINGPFQRHDGRFRTGSSPSCASRFKSEFDVFKRRFGICRILEACLSPWPRQAERCKKEHLTAVAKRHGAEPSKFSNQLKGDLDWIVMKCLEKDRTRRYDTANGLAADLKRHLNDEPVAARPPSAAYKLKKAFRRNKLAFAAVTAIAAMLILGIAASVWQAVRATRAERAAKGEADRATAAEKKAIDTLAQVAAERDAKEQARKDAEAIAKFLSLVGGNDEVRKLEEALSVSYRKDPNSRETALAYAQLGFAADQNGRHDEAIQAWQEAVRVNPSENPEVHYYLGLALMWYKRYAEALPILRATQKFYPDGDFGRETSKLLAQAEAMVGKEKLQARAPDRIFGSDELNAWLIAMRNAFATDPADTKTAKQLATACLWLGQTNMHQAICRKLLDLAANSKERHLP
jgi:tetratricopeptide (TPR) repeat protein